MQRILALSLLVGCGHSLRDDRFATGSTTIVSNRDHTAFIAVNVDESTVSRMDQESGKISEVEVGAEPVRIANVGDSEFWVTLRGERGIAIVTEEDGELRKSGRVDTGAEPYGIVATENGRRVYVAASQMDAVIEYDGHTRDKLRTFNVQDEPKWLTLHPNGNVLFVASAKEGTLSAIDLRSGEVTQIDLPEGTRHGMDGETVELDVRITGDIAILADGTQLAVPTLYADTETSVDSEPGVEDLPDEPVQNGYGSSGLEISRLNPVLVTYDLGAEGLPRDNKAHGLFMAAVDFNRSEPDTFRSYLSSVTGSPTSDEWVVTMEGSNVVLVMSTDEPSERNQSEVMVDMPMSTGTSPEGGREQMPFTSISDGGFESRGIAAVRTGTGPRGVAFAGNTQAWVHTWLDRSIGSLHFAQVEDNVEHASKGEFFEGMVSQWGQETAISSSSLPKEIEDGRRLFFSAMDGRMAGTGAGVSCATCHADGRNDGFTWTLDGQPRQTPSLTGPVNDTAPLTWTEEVDSVATEAQLTTSLRMGGDGLSDVEAGNIQAFIVSQRYPDVRRAGEDSDLLALGREVFERPEVGCASCHSGALYTDNQLHLIIGGEATQTPVLRGISATAPYLHDGTLPTLRDVLTMARGGTMGDTSSLSSREMDALVAYLESL